MAEASRAGRKPTSLTRDQIARREALELVLQYDATIARQGPMKDLDLLERAEVFAYYIESGVAKN